MRIIFLLVATMTVCSCGTVIYERYKVPNDGPTASIRYMTKHSAGTVDVFVLKPSEYENPLLLNRFDPSAQEPEENIRNGMPIMDTKSISPGRIIETKIPAGKIFKNKLSYKAVVANHTSYCDSSFSFLPEKDSMYEATFFIRYDYEKNGYVCGTKFYKLVKNNLVYERKLDYSAKRLKVGSES